MNNIVKKAKERAMSDYTVSIYLDSVDDDLKSELKKFNKVDIDIKEVDNGAYVFIKGDVLEVMETEISIYDIITSSHVYGTNIDNFASVET